MIRRQSTHSRPFPGCTTISHNSLQREETPRVPGASRRGKLEKNAPPVMESQYRSGARGQASTKEQGHETWLGGQAKLVCGQNSVRQLLESDYRQ
jgi:hypothetical protein